MIKKGEFEKARNFFSEALEVRKDVFGENDPITATSYCLLGKIYQRLGDCNKARDYMTKALGILKAVLGDNHRDTVTIYELLESLNTITLENTLENTVRQQNDHR